MADSMDVEEPVPETPGEFVPPSIDEAVLLSGASYSHFSPVPACLLPPCPTSPQASSPAAEAAVPGDSTAAPATDSSADAPAAKEQLGVPCVLGVDEAGRGPVLGPMVYGVFYAPVDEADALLRGEHPDADRDADSGNPHRFDDSKVLSASTRATLMAAVCRPGTRLHTRCGWAVALLSARDIAAGMLSPASAVGGGNLNVQAADATVSLIRGVLARGVRVTDVFVDTVGPPASYQKKLERYFPGLRITVTKKADSLYPCVSAASVCAKVTRDVALEVLYKPHRTAAATATPPDWGSGYPSDARCTTWLRRNMHPVFGWGPECRFSWGTAKDMLEESSKAKSGGGVLVEWPEDDDADDADPDGFAVTRMTDFFTAEPAAGAPGADADAVDELGAWFGLPAGIETF